MRVLRLHAAYAQEGGEDHSFRTEVALLEDGGHSVRTVLRSNAALTAAGFASTLAALWRTPFSRVVYDEVRRACREFRPHVAHADNLWFALSPSVHAACRAEGVATVQTLNNYRLHCLNGLMLRNGRPCVDCLGKSVWTGVRRRCYRGSAVLSAAMARMIDVNRQRGTWVRDVDLFLAPTAFAQRKFIEAGWDPEKIVVKPNFVDDPGPVTRPGRGGVYVGRLSAEKGVSTLIRAWSRLQGVPLTIVGDGPARAALEEEAARLGVDAVFFAGRLDPEGVSEAIRAAAFLVFPSECFETFGRTVVEAFACGRTVLVARGGAAAELVSDGRNGITFARGDDRDLAAKAAWLAARPEPCRRMGEAARRAYRRRYTPEGNLRMLNWAYTIARRAFERSSGAPIVALRPALTVATEPAAAAQSRERVRVRRAQPETAAPVEV